MKPTHYINLTAIGESPMEIVNRLMAVLHGIARQHKLDYATAFPNIRIGERAHPGSVIRVFGEHGSLEKFYSELLNHSFVKDYVRVNAIEAVPANVTSWTQYRLYRIPNRKSRTTHTRQNRINDAVNLPYLRVASRSNGHAYSLRIQPVKVTEATDTCEPNSYGLAVSTRPFSLPDIPFATG